MQLGAAKAWSNAVADRTLMKQSALAPRDPGEGVQVLNPGYFALERGRTEARPREAGRTRKHFENGR